MVFCQLIKKRKVPIQVLVLLCIHLQCYCEYGVPYRVSGITLYPLGSTINDLSIEREVVEISIQKNSMYRNNSTYIIKNNGSAGNYKIGFFLRTPDNSLRFDLPQDLSIVVNDRKMVFKDDQTIINDGNVRIEHFYYVDVFIDTKMTSKLVLNYTSYPQYIAFVEGNDRSNLYPCLNNGVPYTLIIDNQIDDIYMVGNLFFDAITKTYRYFIKDDLLKLETRDANGFTLNRIGDGKWMLNFTDEFVKEYGDRFSINIAVNDSESPLFSFYPDGIDDRISGVWIGSDPDNGNLSKRKLAKYELFFYTKKQLRLLRNIFYARYGYKFKDKQLYAYFMSLNGTTMVGKNIVYKVNSQFNESMFNDIERANIEIIRQLEVMSDEVDK